MSEEAWARRGEGGDLKRMNAHLPASPSSFSAVAHRSTFLCVVLSATQGKKVVYLKLPPGSFPAFNLGTSSFFPLVLLVSYFPPMETISRAAPEATALGAFLTKPTLGLSVRKSCIDRSCPESFEVIKILREQVENLKNRAKKACFSDIRGLSNTLDPCLRIPCKHPTGV